MTMHFFIIMTVALVLWQCFMSAFGSIWWSTIYGILNSTSVEHRYIDHNTMSVLFGCIAWALTFFNVVGLFEIFSTTSVYSIVGTLAWLVLVSIGFISFYHLSFRSAVMLAMPSSMVLPTVFMFIIEVISLSFRTISLSFRLFANILAGHILLHVIFNLCVFAMCVSAVGTVAAVGVFMFICLLEGFMSIIQVYVFTMLSTVYLSEI